jgi:uncharacterized protein YhfF/pimeloyl-ACP methyl ester carboxylesterase
MTAMPATPAIRDFWSAFAAHAGGDVDARFYESFHFSDNQQSTDELGHLAVEGVKRATTSMVWFYESEAKPLPKPGDLSVVTNWNGDPLCVIETVAIDIVPFDEVTAEFAAVEGEGDGSLDYWRAAHVSCFTRECERLGRLFEPSMPVVCERFEVVYRGDANAGTTVGGRNRTPHMSMLLPMTFALLLTQPSPADAQDYARERRWADEIVPAVVVGDPVYLQQVRGKDPSHKFLGLYAEAPNAKTAIVLVHGVGVHPDHGIIGALRVKLNDAGYTTLSIQMPVAGADAKVEDYYPAVFDEAGGRIAVAARWLEQKGYGQSVLLSHSMGAWMANEYLLNADSVPFAAWICMGITGRITSPSSIRIPTFDVYGENDLDNARRAAPWRRLMKLFMASGSEQVEVAGADHFYAGRENDAAREIVRYLKARGL